MTKPSDPSDLQGMGLDGVADLRVTYAEGTLNPQDLAANPLSQFRSWFDEAVASDLVAEPNAMVLATASADAHPSSRTVLLKGADERGFSFFTNLASRKSSELRANPRASVTFPWFAMHRQVVVVGDAKPFIGALISLDPEMVPVWAKNNGIEEQLTLAEATKHPVIIAEMQQAVDEVNKLFSQAEQIKAFEIVDIELTEASGHLTPSLKIKRSKVMEDFDLQVGRIYVNA